MYWGTPYNADTDANMYIHSYTYGQRDWLTPWDPDIHAYKHTHTHAQMQA